MRAPLLVLLAATALSTAAMAQTSSPFGPPSTHEARPTLPASPPFASRVRIVIPRFAPVPSSTR